MARRPGSTWRAVGASVQGVSHVRNGTPCQDSHHALEMDGGILVAAVADGAGSAAVSEVGSALAARAAVEKGVERIRRDLPLTDDAWVELLREVVLTARQTVLEQAEAMELPPLDLATTLVFAITAPDRVAAAQVGDGAVVIRLADESLHSVTRPQAGEFINETTFLTSPNLENRMQLAFQRVPVTGVALFTDGLQMLALKMPQGDPHVPFFLPLLRFVSATDSQAQAENQLQTFLQSPRIRQRADDDLTLMLAVRNGS
jgi:protein phosphatase 2C-like protein